jgi:hypothetical protein
VPVVFKVFKHLASWNTRPFKQSSISVCGDTVVDAIGTSAVFAECDADKQKGKIKHRRKINRTFAYWSTKCILIGMSIKRTIRLALAVFDK